MKKYLLCVVSLLLSVPVWAEDAVTAFLVTDGGAKVEVENVDFLIAADNDTDFSVVLKEGDPLMNVKRVTFETGSAGILTPVADSAAPVTIIGEVSSTLTLSGCEKGSMIAIYSEAGVLVKTAVAGEVTIVNVESLLPGCYILRAGEGCLKFIKK